MRPEAGHPNSNRNCLALRTVSPPFVSAVLYRLQFTSIGEVNVVKCDSEMLVHRVCNTPFGVIYG